jgi:hypothetical protein
MPGFSDLLENPSDAGLSEATGYILSHPPKKQIIRNGVLEWSDVVPSTRPCGQTDPGTDAARAARAVQRRCGTESHELLG